MVKLWTEYKCWTKKSKWKNKSNSGNENDASGCKKMKIQVEIKSAVNEIRLVLETMLVPIWNL